jgi:tight adherence protein C
MDGMMTLGASACAGASVIVLVLGVGRGAKGDAVQQRLERLTRERIIAAEDEELRRPLFERLVRPIVGGMGGVVTRLSRGKSLDKVQRILARADLAATFDASTFTALRFFAGLGFGLGFAVTALVADAGMMQVVLSGAGAAIAASLLPMLWAKGKAKGRQSEIRAALPDMLDMLTLCTGVLSPENALGRVALHAPPTLRRELSRVMLELRAGVMLGDALQHMADRVGLDELTALVAVIVQSRQMGTPLERVLQEQSADMRVKRRQRAETLAREAPIKMMFPLVILVFPPLFIVLLGPSIPQIVHALAPGVHL